MSASLLARVYGETGAVKIMGRHNLRAEEVNAMSPSKNNIEPREFSRPQDPNSLVTTTSDQGSKPDLPGGLKPGGTWADVVRGSMGDSIAPTKRTEPTIAPRAATPSPDKARLNLGGNNGPPKQEESAMAAKTTHLPPDLDATIKPEISIGADSRRTLAPFQHEEVRTTVIGPDAYDERRLSRPVGELVRACNTAEYPGLRRPPDAHPDIQRFRFMHQGTADHYPDAQSPYVQSSMLGSIEERGRSASNILTTAKPGYTVPHSLVGGLSRPADAAHLAWNAVAVPPAGNTFNPQRHCECRAKVCDRCGRTICAECPGLRRSNTR
jgi:hypothetical protein